MKIKFKNKLISSGGLLIAVLMVTNVFNFLFNAILGRVLSLEQFSILTLASTLWLIISIFLNSLASTANNRSAYLYAKRSPAISRGFVGFFMRKSLFISFFLCLLWVIITPILGIIFHTSNYILFLSITPAIIFGTFTAISRGSFQGHFSFEKAAIVIFTESFSKLFFAFVFIVFNLKTFAYLSIPLSITVSFIVAIILLKKMPKEDHSHKYSYPRKLLVATSLTAIGNTAFLTMDLLLARHYLTPLSSGAYSLLSLVGTMIFFSGTLFGVFILTFASRDTGLNKNSVVNFYRILAINTAILFVGFLTLGVFGELIIPILWGAKSIVIFPYLIPYTLAMSFFALATSFATYHLAKNQYIFSYNGIFAAALVIVGVMIFHSSIYDLVSVVLFSSYIYLATNILLHVFYKDISDYIDEEDKLKLSRFANILQDKISVSICIPAFNEEKNIGKLVQGLLKQQTRHIDINKIVVISSASTDRTNEIVKNFVDKYPEKVVLLVQKTRRGKAAAINTFLKHVNDPIVVVQSADTLPLKDTIEKLCRPFLVDGNIGMTGGAPYPINDSNNFLGYVIHTWWWFHRHIPRFGEIIAFRNIIDEVSPRTAVDEAYIQAKFAQIGLKIVHVNEAKIYNKGAESIKDMITQRRRIFNGHTRLLQEEHVHISSVSKSGLKLLLFDYKMYSPIHLVWLAGGIVIEIWANILGQYDKRVNHKNPVVWDIATTTKNLAGSKGGMKE